MDEETFHKEEAQEGWIIYINFRLNRFLKDMLLDRRRMFQDDKRNNASGIIIYIYMPQNRVSKYMKQNLIELKGEIYIIVLS